MIATHLHGQFFSRRNDGSSASSFSEFQSPRSFDGFSPMVALNLRESRQRFLGTIMFGTPVTGSLPF